ncbi:DUF4350 domain-containing protein [Cellvibrio sp. ARAG 10.3]|uniref:DUF4350 domain-containing protein n=1 Tax=Cellvibrio sp. ARAG 10.3 TaxID=3451358 RepID=UPI003F4811AB
MASRISTNKLLILAIIAVTIGLLFWASRYITWKEEEIDLGYSREAQKDDFLAIKQFLAQQGIESQSLRSFGLLDNLAWQGERLGARDTLVLLNAHKMLRGQRLDNLLGWVEQGGTVITSTHNPFVGADGSDPLLDHFGILVGDYDEAAEDTGPVIDDSVNETSTESADQSLEDDGDDASPKENDEESEEEEKLPDNHFRCALYLEPQAVDFFGEDEPLLIDYSDGEAFDYYDEEPQGWSGDDRGLHLAQFEWGQGLVIVNSDNDIWTNQRVDCHDHAYALWKLIDHDGKVWFLINQEAPSLWSLLWQAVPYGMLAALLALGFWLWAKAVRFGPILTRKAEGRRSLAEHIHASAMLLWRRQQHPYLVDRLREEVRQQLHQHYPQFSQFSEREQISHLQQLTALSASELHRALFSDNLQHPHDFTSAVACLQTIRNNI